MTIRETPDPAPSQQDNPLLEMQQQMNSLRALLCDLLKKNQELREALQVAIAASTRADAS